jgi:hypothetical protein
MDFYAPSNVHPSQLYMRSEEASSSTHFHQRVPSSYPPSGTLAPSQVFAGPPWGTCGYIDEVSLLEGKKLTCVTSSEIDNFIEDVQSWASILSTSKPR